MKSELQSVIDHEYGTYGSMMLSLDLNRSLT